MYKKDWALNNLQWLICHKTKPNQIKYLIYMYKKDWALNNLQWLICHKTKPNQTKRSICSKRIKTDLDPHSLSTFITAGIYIRM